MADSQFASSSVGGGAAAMETAPAIMIPDPARTSILAEVLSTFSSPKTRAPQANPHNWFVLERGIPRPMPMYLAAKFWKRSPITQQKPPRNGQNSMGLALCSSLARLLTPPYANAPSTNTVPNSPKVKMVTKESGFMPLIYALR